MTEQIEASRVEAALLSPPEGAIAPRVTPDVLVLVSLTTALLATSFSAIFIRVSEVDLGPNGTVFNRFLIFFLAFGAGRLLSRRAEVVDATEIARERLETKQAYGWRELSLLFSVGLVSSISLVLWAFSLAETTVAKSILLNNFTPVFTTLGGWFFFGKRFDRRFLIGMCVAIVGVLTIAYEDLSLAHGGHWYGDLLALLSAVFLGSYYLLVEQLRDRLEATTILLWRCGVGCLLLIPIVCWQEGGQFFAHSWLGWMAAIGLGLICEGMGQRLLAACLDRLSAGFVSLFLLLEPLIGALLAWTIFGERLSGGDGIAFAIVLYGIYIAQTSSSAAKAVGD
ncbi:MAG: DMT family transporter [Cyanobacteria bacterium J06641_5]